MKFKGMANLEVTTNHFLRLKKDKRLLKGWASSSQIDSAFKTHSVKTFQKLSDELIQTNKAAIFHLHSENNIYLIPLTDKTNEFCRQMSISPESE